MDTRIASALAGGLAVAIAATAIPAAAPAPSGVTVLYRGRCAVPEGVRASSWDVGQLILRSGSPTWLPVHTHKGIECYMNIGGSASALWEAAPTPGARATPFPVRDGGTRYIAQGTVHTAGDPGPSTPPYAATEEFLAVHVLVGGSKPSYPAHDPSAPAPVSTNVTKLFDNVFAGQPAFPGAFTVESRIVQIEPGSVYSVPASRGRSYYTVYQGSARVRYGLIVRYLRPTQYLAVQSGIATTIAASASTPTRLVATEIRPGPVR